MTALERFVESLRAARETHDWALVDRAGRKMIRGRVKWLGPGGPKIDGCDDCPIEAVFRNSPAIMNDHTAATRTTAEGLALGLTTTEVRIVVRGADDCPEAEAIKMRATMLDALGLDEETPVVFEDEP